jgi:hypothetical protein
MKLKRLITPTHKHTIQKKKQLSRDNKCNDFSDFRMIYYNNNYKNGASDKSIIQTMAQK